MEQKPTKQQILDAIRHLTVIEDKDAGKLEEFAEALSMRLLQAPRPITAENCLSGWKNWNSGVE